MADPISIFKQALEEAKRTESFDASRCAMASTSVEGVPSVRFLLVKEVDERGFVFYTNFESPKAFDLRANPYAALAFHWSTTGVQVRVSGSVELVGAEEADAYFATRPRGSQIGAWASQQSEELSERAVLQARFASLEEQFRGREIPRPEFWGGYRIVPDRIEFWYNREDRLHERQLFTRSQAGWTAKLLYP